MDLTELSTSNFYPVVFPNSMDILDCEIHSEGLSGNAAYNQNAIHFQFMAMGWSDTPRQFTILQYGVYDANEITIGCIADSSRDGAKCV